MLKKLISYLIIFSILFPDVVHCGSIWVKEVEDAGEHDHLAVKRQSAQVPLSHDGEVGERTPLVFSGHSDPTSIPGIPINFQDVAQSSSQGQSLPVWPQGGGTKLPDKEEESSSSEEIIFNRNVKSKATNVPKAADSKTGNPENLPIDETRSSRFKPGDPKGKEPRTTLEPDGADSQEGARLKFRSESEENAYNQQSWKQLSELQKQALTGGELNSFSRNFIKNSELINPKQGSLNLQIQDEEDEDTKDFFMVPLDKLSTLSPEAKDFLRYVKVRIVDGKLNWKQILGIGGGMVIGAGVAWPMMCILFNALLEFYANATVNSLDSPGSPLVVNPDFLTKQFRHFNQYINFKTMMVMVGIPTGIATASQMASILMDCVKDNIQSFSIQRSKKHVVALIGAKAGVCLGVLLGGLLPIYFLYKAVLRDCFLGGDIQWNNTGVYEEGYYSVSTDLFLKLTANVTYYTMNVTFESDICTQFNTPHQLLQKIYLFGIGAPFLFLNTFLRYAHQLSKSATEWINDYFFTQIRQSTHLSSIEANRQGYITQFKELKRMMNDTSETELKQLYHEMFKNKMEKTDLNFAVNSAKFTASEAIYILSAFKKFYNQHVLPVEEENSDTWKKTWASRIGWAIPLVATIGRMIIFQYVIQNLLNSVVSDYHHYNTISIFSTILGYSFAHLSQGWAEKEAVEKSVYEILGGRKTSDGNSHKSFRTGLKVWGYIYGAFYTLPYLILGLTSPDRFSTDLEDLDGMLRVVDVRQILFLLSFGIADAFNNAATFNYANLNLVNAFDSAKSYWAPSVEYKQDKLKRTIHQLCKVFEKLSPDILKEIDQQLDKDQGKQLQNDLNMVSLDEHLPPILRLEREKKDEERDFAIVPHFSSKVQEFLYYFKNRTIDGKLNGKQKIGIVGGMVTGAAIAWPMMLIIFDGLLTPYSKYIVDKYDITHETGENIINEVIKNFHSYLNFKTIMALVGVPMAIDAAFRTASILIDFTADKIKSFSLQKIKTHEWTLFAVKSSIYFGVFFASILPVYYLHGSTMGCNKNNQQVERNNTCYTFILSTDVFLNLSSQTQVSNDPDNCFTSNCSAIRSDLPVGNIMLFGIGAPFLFFDIFLQYSHQLSHHAEQWINDYFFTQLRKSSQFTFAESLRQKYLTQFKNIKQKIYASDEKAIGNVYDDVFARIGIKTEYNSDLDGIAPTLTEAIRILKVFNNLHPQDETHLEEEPSEDWKKTWSSRIGWAIPLIATFGRMLIFQYIIEEIFGIFGFEGMGASFLSAILGGIFANLAQGWIEKDGVQKGVYEILGGKKPSNGQSHKPLRIGIKIWDYIYGTFHTLPYLAIGKFASQSEIGFETGPYLAPWQYLLLIPFGLADAFNNAIAFHDSNLKVVDAYDSVRSYWSPTPEYKRDKLVRVMHQLRKLFKELDHDVLLEVDQVLNGSPRGVQLDQSEIERI